MSYCKFIVLPKAREVLNSVGIEYSFGKFSIKIDNDNEGKKDPMKTEEWLVEEKSVEKWSPKLETIQEENQKMCNDKAKNQKRRIRLNLDTIEEASILAAEVFCRRFLYFIHPNNLILRRV